MVLQVLRVSIVIRRIIQVVPDTLVVSIHKEGKKKREKNVFYGNLLKTVLEHIRFCADRMVVIRKTGVFGSVEANVAP